MPSCSSNIKLSCDVKTVPLCSGKTTPSYDANIVPYCGGNTTPSCDAKAVPSYDVKGFLLGWDFRESKNQNYEHKSKTLSL